MSEHTKRRIPPTHERGQEPSLATATKQGAPGEAPARQGQEREG